jgi:hypothetical protein
MVNKDTMLTSVQILTGGYGHWGIGSSKPVDHSIKRSSLKFDKRIVKINTLILCYVCIYAMINRLIVIAQTLRRRFM